ESSKQGRKITNIDVVADVNQENVTDADGKAVVEEMVEVLTTAKIIVDEVSTAGGELNAANEEPVSVAPINITVAQPKIDVERIKDSKKRTRKEKVKKDQTAKKQKGDELKQDNTEKQKLEEQRGGLLGYKVFIKLLPLIIIMKKTQSVSAVSAKSYCYQFKLMLLEEEITTA
nr:hypothetical protein [Tanacetum cinerariifolium]